MMYSLPLSVRIAFKRLSDWVSRTSPESVMQARKTMNRRLPCALHSSQESWDLPGPCATHGQIPFSHFWAQRG